MPPSTESRYRSPKRPPLTAFVRASTLHIGAAAVAASLRQELVRDHGLRADEIDTAYAVSRVTPGTNMLALYAVLGYRLGGWLLGLQAVALGVLLPAVILLAITVAYTHATSSTVASLMGGARAGGVAVVIGAALRLLRPQLVQYRATAAAFAVIAFVVAWVAPVGLFIVLLAAGAAGAMVLRPGK